MVLLRLSTGVPSIWHLALKHQLVGRLGGWGAMSGPRQLKTSHGNARAPRVDAVNTARADSPVSAMAIAQT